MKIKSEGGCLVGLFKKNKQSQSGNKKNPQPDLGKTSIVKGSLYDRVFTDKPPEKKSGIKLATKSVDYVNVAIPENRMELLADNALAGTLPDTSSLFSVYVDSSVEEDFPPFINVSAVLVPSYAEVYANASEFMNEIRIQHELEQQQQVEVARKEKENLIASMQHLDLKVTDLDGAEESVPQSPLDSANSAVKSSPGKKKSAKRTPRGTMGVGVPKGSPARKTKTAWDGQQSSQQASGQKRKVVPKIYE